MVVVAGRSLHGRIFQDKNQVYMLPTDRPEIERLDRQHRLLTLAIGGLCWPMEAVTQVLASRGNTARILDVGSGSGRWAIEMAKAFPQAEVLGIDLAPKRPSDTPENCRFEVLDVMDQDISHLQGAFDIVHSRAVGGGIRCYESFLERIAGMVKPGGLFLVAEGNYMVYNEPKQLLSPAYAGQDPEKGSWLARLLHDTRTFVQKIEDLQPAGWEVCLPKWLMEDSRLENVEQKNFYIPIGWKGGDENDIANGEEVGKIMIVNILELMQSFRPGLLAAGLAEEEVDMCIRKNEAELLHPQSKRYLKWTYSVSKAKLSAL